MMMPRKKRRAIIMSVIFVVFVLIFVICLTLYMTTDMFKSNEVLFKKYATQFIENLDGIFNEDNMSEMKEVLNNNKLTSNTTTTVNYSENGDTSNPINQIQMKIAGQEEKTTGYMYQNVTLSQNEDTLLGFEYIEDENIAGVRLNGIKQYVSTNIENEQDDDNEIYNLYQLIHTNIVELLNLDSEELQALKDKYVRIILENMTNVSYSKQTGIVLEIDGTQYTTNAYNVTLTKEQFNNIYIQLLKELENEEVVLSKLEDIDNALNEYHNLMQDEKTSNLKQQFIDKISGTMEEIESSNIGNDERTIRVFEANGIAISLTIDTEEEAVGIDSIHNEGVYFINFLGNKKVEEEEKENRFDFKIQKTALQNNEDIKIQYTIVEEGEETANECTITRKMENANVNTDIHFSRNVGKNTFEVAIENITNIVNQFEEKEELIENENNIIIENLNDEQKENVRNNMKDNITNQLNKVFEVLPLENIDQMLINVKLKEEELDDISGEGTITEIEKNRFNTTFELYEGERISKERVEELINIAKDNLGDVRITNYKEERNERIPLEYRLVIERGTENSELAESVITYIEENYNKEFSVRLEYDETTGLVNNIYITVIES